MPKSLNDILKGVKKSTTEKLTTGENPGVDYADKMKDTRDFVAQHSVEKHADRVGNEDDVYKGSTKKADMKRHGHEPAPKDTNIYKKNQQVGQAENIKEEIEVGKGYAIKLPNGKLAKASNGKTWWHSQEEGAHKTNKASHGGEGKVVKVKLDSDQYGYNGRAVKEEVELSEIMQGSKEHLAKLKEMHKNSKPGSADRSQIAHAIEKMFGPEHIPEAKACDSCGKTPCSCGSDDKPKKAAKKLLLDKDIKEGLIDQRSSKSTSSETARDKIYTALQRRKERIEKEKMKESAAPTETPITFPATNSREGFRV